MSRANEGGPTIDEVYKLSEEQIWQLCYGDPQEHQWMRSEKQLSALMGSEIERLQDLNPSDLTAEQALFLRKVRSVENTRGA